MGGRQIGGGERSTWKGGKKAEGRGGGEGERYGSGDLACIFPMERACSPPVLSSEHGKHPLPPPPAPQIRLDGHRARQRHKLSRYRKQAKGVPHFAPPSGGGAGGGGKVSGWGWEILQAFEAIFV